MVIEHPARSATAHPARSTTERLARSSSERRSSSEPKASRNAETKRPEPPLDAGEAQAWRIAAAVADPEVPVLTIEDLGVLRAVEVDGDTVRVDLTPTYSGCPAMDAIRDDVILALTAAGYQDVAVRLVLSPAWTTDWMTDAGKRKLAEYGIAPPTGRAAGSLSLAHAPQRLESERSDDSSGAWGAKGSTGPIRLALSVRCPRCGSLDTREVSRFGSTSCKALFECRACLEPFDHFKVH